MLVVKVERVLRRMHEAFEIVFNKILNSFLAEGRKIVSYIKNLYICSRVDVLCFFYSFNLPFIHPPFIHSFARFFVRSFVSFLNIYT